MKSGYMKTGQLGEYLKAISAKLSKTGGVAEWTKMKSISSIMKKCLKINNMYSIFVHARMDNAAKRRIKE